MMESIDPLSIPEETVNPIFHFHPGNEQLFSFNYKEELARQVTLVHYEIYLSIEGRELIYGKVGENITPNLCNMIKHYQKVIY